MGPLATPQPTLAGFQAWVTNVAGVPSAAIDTTNAIYETYAYNTAVAIVNPAFQSMPGPIYLEMVYNLAMDRLVNWCPDVTPPTPYVPGPGQPANPDGLGFFAYLRVQFKVNAFIAGVIQAAGDEGTNETLLVPDQFKNITVSQLQNLKTSWGKVYLGYAQDYGTNWGLT